jgi:hypothetical protein
MLKRADALALVPVVNGTMKLFVHVESAPDILMVLALKKDYPALNLVLVGATDLHRAWPLLSGDRSGRVTVARLGRVLRGLAGHVKGHAQGRRHPIDNDLVRDACRSVHGSADPLYGVLT